MPLLENESTIRLSIFIAILLIMIIWQSLFPRRQLNATVSQKTQRWGSHGLMMMASTVLIKLLLPASAVAFASHVNANDIALINISIPVVVGIIMLDLLIYWQHRLFHQLPILWRLHKVHHSDSHLDASSALRFHPVEILLSMLIKFAAIGVFGFTAETVILFEIILNGMAIFNHSNARLPGDGFIRWCFVTPDMHRVHHSIHHHETNSNYGFNISIWDRLFKTYNAQPKDGHEKMTIGLIEYPRGEASIKGLLLMPFVATQASKDSPTDS